MNLIIIQFLIGLVVYISSIPTGYAEQSQDCVQAVLPHVELSLKSDNIRLRQALSVLLGQSGHLSLNPPPPSYTSYW